VLVLLRMCDLLSMVLDCLSLEMVMFVPFFLHTVLPNIQCLFNIYVCSILLDFSPMFMFAAICVQTGSHQRLKTLHLLLPCLKHSMEGIELGTSGFGVKLIFVNIIFVL